ncbi:MAG: hypothetical protein LBC02_14870 [Planctomycetaceae bacterium]|nr:hypothetical protein [Planctomycetaceae bacterium]
MTHIWSKMISFLLGVLLFIGISIVVYAEETDRLELNILLPEITVVLEKNAKYLDNLSIVFRRTRSTDIPLEQLLKQINGVREYGFFEKSNHVFMWRCPCFYQANLGKFVAEIDETGKLPFAYEKNLKLLDFINEKSFDGNNYMYGSGGFERTERVTPAVGLELKEQLIRDAGKSYLLDSMYLWASGYKFPILVDDIGTPQVSSVTFLASHGQINRLEKQTMDGEESVFLEIRAKDIFTDNQRIYSLWLLPKHQYVTKRMLVKTLDGRNLYEIKNEDYIKVNQDGLFFPKVCKISYYYWHNNVEFISDALLFTEVYSLAEVSTKSVAIDQFDIRKKYSSPGTVVADRTLRDTDAGVQYTIPANPADLDRVIEAALNGTDFVPTPLPSTAAIVIKWLLCIAGIAMILYAAYKKFIKNKSK